MRPTVFDMTEKKELVCRTCEANGVKTAIFFSPSVKSASGKMIPIEVESKRNHSCPFRQSAPKQSAPTVPATVNAGTPVQVVAPVADSSPLLKEIKAQLDRLEAAVTSLVLGESAKPANAE